MRRWFALALAAGLCWETAPAAELPRSRVAVAPDQPAGDRAILNGYRRYNASCSHCHGPDGVGSTFAPSLIESPLPLEPFQEVVRNGQARGGSVMRGFADDPNVAPHIGDIYAYLQARAAGSIGRGRPKVAR